MTTTTKTKLRPVSHDAAELRLFRDTDQCVLIERKRHTLIEGEDIVILSSDGTAFVGFVYGFEKLSNGNTFAIIELDK